MRDLGIDRAKVQPPPRGPVLFSAASALRLLGVVDEALLLALILGVGLVGHADGVLAGVLPLEVDGILGVYCRVSRIVAGSNVKRSTTCSLSLLRTGVFRKPGRKPTVSTISVSPSQRPIEWPARVGFTLAGWVFWFM